MHITAAHQFAATASNENVILESSTIYLALTAIENTESSLSDACSDWHKHLATDQMLAKFCTDFTHAWHEPDHCISAKTAGYQALLMTF
jgi:hypothetical protein